MTYNTHGCVGTDGALDIARIARVIARHSPDIVTLQEIDLKRGRSGHKDQARELAGELGMDAYFTCAVRESEGEGQYGIALLTAHGVEIVSEGCLPGRIDEVRAAQWARLKVHGVSVEIIHSHLSVHFIDRHAQLKALLGKEWLEEMLEHPHLIVCGDLNATPYSPVYRALRRHLADVQRLAAGPRRATWPSRLPLLRLDHVFVGKGFGVKRTLVPRDSLTALASDHLPLVADLTIHA
jgi:endonuclease/exonuclease/phosphatase family metal-dependent hydrolase